jgi:hypothetical protein
MAKSTTERISSCIDLQDELKLIRERTGVINKSYQKNILELSNVFKALAEDPSEFIDASPIISSLYGSIPYRFRNKRSKLVRTLEPWILLEEVINKQINDLNGYSGCNVCVEYAYADRDDNIWTLRNEKGFLLRAGLEKSIFSKKPKPLFFVAGNDGKERQYDLTPILIGKNNYDCLRNIRVHTEDKNKYPREIIFPTSELVLARSIAKEALEVYQRKELEQGLR